MIMNMGIKTTYSLAEDPSHGGIWCSKYTQCSTFVRCNEEENKWGQTRSFVRSPVRNSAVDLEQSTFSTSVTMNLNLFNTEECNITVIFNSNTFRNHCGILYYHNTITFHENTDGKSGLVITAISSTHQSTLVCFTLLNSMGWKIATRLLKPVSSPWQQSRSVLTCTASTEIWTSSLYCSTAHEYSHRIL